MAFSTISSVLAGTLMVGQIFSGGDYKPAKPRTAEPIRLRASSQTLFPMAVGNMWTYNLEIQKFLNGKETSNGRTDLTYKVTKAVTKNGITTSTMDLIQQDQVMDRQVWQTTPQGIYQLSIGLGTVTPFAPKQPAMMLPVTSGAVFSWKGSGTTPSGLNGTSTVRSKVLGKQAVDTDMGRVEAIAIESVTNFKVSRGTGRSIATAWYRPGTGIVRFRQQTDLGNVSSIVLLKIRNFTVQ